MSFLPFLALWAFSLIVTACTAEDNAVGQTHGNDTAESRPKVQTFSSDYMAQEPPGFNPVVFAPGLISTQRTEIAFEMSSDGSEIYFVRLMNNIPRIFWTTRGDSGWTTPAPVPGIGDQYSTHPSLDCDGMTLFFSSKRPLPEDWPGPRPAPDSREAFNVWRARRDGTAWGPPRPLILPGGEGIADVAVSTSGTIYVSGIMRAVFWNGRYRELERLTPHLEGQWPYIAPDESFIVYGFGFPRRLLVSSRNADGVWTEPRSVSDGFGFEIGEMNGMPFVTPDRRYMFFTAKHDIYWVDARILGN